MHAGDHLEVDAMVVEGRQHAEAGHDGPDGVHAVYDAHGGMLCTVPHMRMRGCFLPYLTSSSSHSAKGVVASGVGRPPDKALG